MANDITGNPHILDTASGTLVWKGNVHILNIEFQDYLNDADTCQLTDAAGRVIWSGNGAADLSVVRSGNLGFIHDGYALTALTNGIVRVFHE